MGFNMWKNHLKRTVQYLVDFERKPKVIKGRTITDWFRVGESIFTELYRLGDSVKWNYSAIKKDSDISEFITLITKNEEWLQTFISIYPTLRVDLDLAGSASDICTVRSGIEVLLQGFTGIDNQFNTVLKDLKELGEVDELDRCLKIWRDSGHCADFAPDDKNWAIPDKHWWWH